MKKIFRSLAAALMLVILCLPMIGCNGTPEDPDKDHTGGEDLIRTGILEDKTFEKGFSIAYMSDKNYIDYGGTIQQGEWRWGINEEGSADVINADTAITEEDGFQVFRSANGSKTIKVDTETGRFYLELNASVDYGDHIRQDGEAWPHLLFTQNYDEGKLPLLSQMQNLYMEIDFDFVKFEDKMGDSANRNKHACQFQWYVAIKNVNPDSPDFGDWFWLGLQFFDNRYTFCPQNLIVDGGKDTATGKAIYTVDMRSVMNKKVVEAGESYSVKFDILPEIENALLQLKDFEDMDTLRHTELKDLRIFHTNIGWEMPGSYDAAVQVNSWDFVYTTQK